MPKMNLNTLLQRKSLRELATKKYVLLVVMLLVLGSVGVTFAAPRIASTLATGTGYDPLSAAEQARVLDVAISGSNLAMAQAGRTEVLLVERHQENKDVYRQGAWPRRSDVYIYHYDTDQLEVVVVDNTKNSIDARTFYQNEQLPPTDNEIQTAIATIFADPQMRPQLNQWYTQLTGEELLSADQISGKGFIFRADSMGLDNAGETANCGLNRCVQMLLYTKDVVAFDVSPIMNLSTLELLTLSPPTE